MVITTNMPALTAWRQGKTAGTNMTKSMEKLSSGYRINRAADDAAGLGISEKMRAQITGLSRSGLNVAEGMSLINTADGALSTLNDMFKRADELCLTAANGTIGSTERQAISAELEDIFSEVERISHATKFNEIPLFQYTETLTTMKKVLEDVHYATIMNPIPPSVTPPSKQMDGPRAAVPALVKFPFTPAGPTVGDAFDGQSVTFQTATTPSTTKTVTFTTSSPAPANNILLTNAGDPIGDTEIRAVLNTMASAFSPPMCAVTYAGGEVTFTHNAQPGTFVGKTILGLVCGNGAQISGFLGAGTFAGGQDGLPINSTIDFTSLATPADIAGLHATSFTVDCGTCVNIISRVIFMDSTRYTGQPIAATTTTGNITTHNLVVDISAIKTPKDLAANIAARWTSPHLTNFTVDPTDPKKLVAHRNDLSGNVAAYVKTSTQTLNWTMKEWVEKAEGREVPGQIDIFVASLPYQEFIPLHLPFFDAKSLSLDGEVNISTAEEAFQYQDKVHKADQMVTTARADLGADYNRLASTAQNLEHAGENMTAAESRIRDLDMPREYSRYVATTILSQAANAMLAQANMAPQSVLSLLRA